jgi:hypothetical protein
VVEESCSPHGGQEDEREGGRERERERERERKGLEQNITFKGPAPTVGH